jgi:CheY-like chemotaxis protein
MNTTTSLVEATTITDTSTESVTTEIKLPSPVNPSAIVKPKPQPQPQRKLRAKSKRINANSLAGLRFLIVDDIDINLKVVGRLLANIGAHCSIAKDGVEAMAMLALRTPDQDQVFDLVLLDVDMPRLDGPGVLREMAEHHINVPVIMLSGNVDLSIKMQCLNLGAKGFLLKPLRLKRALALFREHILKLNLSSVELPA